MIQNILQSTVLYWASALDLLVILTLLYVKFDRKYHLQIMLGQMVGSLFLVLISLILAVVLHLIIPTWLLGILGSVPIYFGLNVLFSHEHDEEDEAREVIEKRENKNLFLTAALLAFASCGADNIGLFTPYFATLSNSKIEIALLVFVINIIILGIASDRLAHIPKLNQLLTRYNRWIIGIVYLALGLLIFIDSGTIGKLLSFI